MGPPLAGLEGATLDPAGDGVDLVGDVDHDFLLVW
jgi:hypothetical protein